MTTEVILPKKITPAILAVHNLRGNVPDAEAAQAMMDYINAHPDEFYSTPFPKAWKAVNIDYLNSRELTSMSIANEGKIVSLDGILYEYIGEPINE